MSKLKQEIIVVDRLGSWNRNCNRIPNKGRSGGGGVQYGEKGDSLGFALNKSYISNP